MNFIVLLFILLITMLSYIDNRKTMRIEPWLFHKHRQIHSNHLHKQSRRKRHANCALPCQSRGCCQRTRCLCVRDYWGPVCYCRK